MEQLTYRGKMFWPPSTAFECLNCGGPIQYSPLALGLKESIDGGGIVALGYFCCWPCERSHADSKGLSSDDVERCTTTILLDFKNEFGPYDDPDGHKFLQQYNLFSEIPRGPSREEFTRYGGTLTYAELRKRWCRIEEDMKMLNIGDYLDSKSYTAPQIEIPYTTPAMWDTLGAQNFNPLVPAKRIMSTSTKRRTGIRPKTSYDTSWLHDDPSDDWSGEYPLNE